MVPLIDLPAQQAKIRESIDKRINKVLAHGQYILGPEVAELEEKLAAYVGVKHCITCANGTDALLIALMALNIGPGDEVITSPFTYVATAEVIVRLGAIPVFVDIDPKTYNIDPDKMESAITPKTKAIIPVSLFGQCADFTRINEIASRHNLPVIEDGAQSFGATHCGKYSGGLSTIGCTSFFPTKPFGCYGDGGACFTDDENWAREMRMIRKHGQDKKYHYVRFGLNSRLDTLQAAILLAKLEIFAEEVDLRKTVAEKYNKMLGDNKNIILPYIAPESESVYCYYTIQIPERDKLQKILHEHDIATGIYYPSPLHLQPAFQALLGKNIVLPVVEVVSGRVLSLPMDAWLSEKTQQEITKIIKDNIW